MFARQWSTQCSCGRRIHCPVPLWDLRAVSETEIEENYASVVGPLHQTQIEDNYASLVGSLRLLEEAVQTECRDQAVQTEKYLTVYQDQAVQVESRPNVDDLRDNFEDIELQAMAAGGRCQCCGGELQVSSSLGVCNHCILNCKLEQPEVFKHWAKKTRPM